MARLATLRHQAHLSLLRFFRLAHSRKRVTMLWTGKICAYYVGAIVCIAGFLFGYDSGIVGGVLTLKSFQHHFDFTTKQKTRISSLCVSLQQLGAFVACIAIIPVSRKYGRKYTIFWCSFVFCIGAVLQTVPSASLACFYVGRVIAGLGLGGMTTVVPTYNAEMAPKELRGRIGSFFQFFFTLGIFTSYWVDYGVQVNMKASNMQWQIPVGLQILFAGLLGLGILTLKESTRWLAKQDRSEEAWASLTWVRVSDGPEVQAEMAEIQESIRAEQAFTEGLSYKEFLKWAVFKRQLAGWVLFLAQQATGATAFAYYSPQYFTLLVGDDEQRSLLLSGIFGAVKVLACLAFVCVAADRWGRKANLTGGAFGMAICQIATAIVLKEKPIDKSASAHVPPSAKATVALIYLFVIVYNFSWGPLPWPYCNEFFSNRYREVGVSVAVSSQWLWNFVFTISTPYMIDSMGWGTFLLWGLFDVVIGLGTIIFATETAGLSLEEAAGHTDVPRSADKILPDDNAIPHDNASTSGSDTKNGGQINERTVQH